MTANPITVISYHRGQPLVRSVCLRCSYLRCFVFLQVRSARCDAASSLSRLHWAAACSGNGPTTRAAGRHTKCTSLVCWSTVTWHTRPRLTWDHMAITTWWTSHRSNRLTRAPAIGGACAGRPALRTLPRQPRAWARSSTQAQRARASSV